MIVCIIISLLGCSWSNVSNKYEAYWYETYYELILNKNQTFKYRFEGHRGNLEYRGTYEIVNDTLILNEPTKKLEESKFLIDGSECLIELETRFDYCKIKK